MNIYKNVLITGALGFIGHHTAMLFLRRGHHVTGIDQEPKDQHTSFRTHRKKQLLENDRFSFRSQDIRDINDLKAILEAASYDLIIHLAAKTGVRDSAAYYNEYISTNINGTFNILEANKDLKIPVIFASSSSVYGANSETPYQEHQKTTAPLSVYAATKASSELFAYQHAVRHNIPTTALRFFTVYGPWGRPDMAVYKFIDAVENGKPITLYGKGELQRDFTYVDDVVKCIYQLSEVEKSSELFQVYNIACGEHRSVNDLVKAIELCSGKKAIIQHEEKVFEDMSITKAGLDKINSVIDIQNPTKLEEGIRHTYNWFKTL